LLTSAEEIIIVEHSRTALPNKIFAIICERIGFKLCEGAKEKRRPCFFCGGDSDVGFAWHFRREEARRPPFDFLIQGALRPDELFMFPPYSLGEY
jgi:hypothetical protein